MKKLILLILLVVLIILFGTYPLTLLAKIFEWIAYGLKWLAKILDFFNINKLL